MDNIIIDSSLRDIFELNASPMLAVENYKVILANRAACTLWGRELEGSSAAGLLPDHIFSRGAEDYVCPVLIDENNYSAMVRCSGDILLISLAADSLPESADALLSDFLMNSMLSSLQTLGVCISRLRQDLSSHEDDLLQRHLCILSHNYSSLRRSLVNLNTAMLLKNKLLYADLRSSDLCLLCSELASSVSFSTAETGVNFCFSTALDRLNCTLDRELTERAILNILSNSFAHTAPGGKVSMRLEKLGSNAVISIDDTGSGIPSWMMPKLFRGYDQPLTRENLSRGSTGGLGLSVARGIMEKHGGALIIESREGVGTSVRLLLPINTATATLESEDILPRSLGLSGVLSELSTVLGSSMYKSIYLDS